MSLRAGVKKGRGRDSKVKTEVNKYSKEAEDERKWQVGLGNTPAKEEKRII